MTEKCRQKKGGSTQLKVLDTIKMGQLTVGEVIAR